MQTRNRAYKYRFYPTPEQEALLVQTFGCVRKVYNLILKWRSLAFQERQEKINYSRASARLTELKKLPENVAECHAKYPWHRPWHQRPVRDGQGR